MQGSNIKKKKNKRLCQTHARSFDHGRGNLSSFRICTDTPAISVLVLRQKNKVKAFVAPSDLPHSPSQRKSAANSRDGSTSFSGPTERGLRVLLFARPSLDMMSCPACLAPAVMSHHRIESERFLRRFRTYGGSHFSIVYRVAKMRFSPEGASTYGSAYLPLRVNILGIYKHRSLAAR